MGTSEMWTADNTVYRFTESTSLDPTHGEIIVEPAELRRRMIHVRRMATPTAHSPQPIDYAALRSRPIDRSDPATYAPHLRYSLMVAALCNNASVHYDNSEWKTVGDPTEVALTVAAQKANAGPRYWTDQLGYRKVFERAFDSERKLMSSAYASSQSEITVLCKGAPEELLRKCTSYLPVNNTGSSSLTSSDEKQVPMDEEFATLVTDESSRMASQGLRVLGLAMKTSAADMQMSDLSELSKLPSLAENNFIFVGLVGLIDPPKQGVKESVETCQQAGIRVMMITGDHVETAVAIASKLGIFKADVPGMVNKSVHVECIF